VVGHFDLFGETHFFGGVLSFLEKGRKEEREQKRESVRVWAK
jgi:hypothetical protein